MPLYTPGRRRAIVLLLLTSVLLLTLDLRGNAIFDAARAGFNKAMRAVRVGGRRRDQPDPQRVARASRDYEDVEDENQRLRDAARRPARRPDRRPGGDPGLPGAARRSTTCRALGDYPTRRRPRSSARARATSTRSSRSTRARNDGIEVGMAVIDAAGLVGKITDAVLPDRARRDADHRPAATRSQVKVVAGAPPPTTDHDDDRRRRPRRRTCSRRRRARRADVDDRHDVATTTVAADHDASPAPRRSTTVDDDHDDRPDDRTRETGQLVGRRAPTACRRSTCSTTRPTFGAHRGRRHRARPPAAATAWRPPDIPIGVVANVISRSPSEGPLLEVAAARRPRPSCTSSQVILYKPDVRGRAADADTQAGG